jgi:hypothetical protein
MLELDHYPAPAGAATLDFHRARGDFDQRSSGLWVGFWQS